MLFSIGHIDQSITPPTVYKGLFYSTHLPTFIVSVFVVCFVLIILMGGM